MLWPVLLLIAGLVAMILGFVASFSGPFHSPARWQQAMVLLLPGGLVAVVVAVGWVLLVWLRPAPLDDSPFRALTPAEIFAEQEACRAVGMLPHLVRIGGRVEWVTCVNPKGAAP